MRLNELAREFNMGGIGNLQQHDRQVTRDRVAPQARLSATIRDQNTRGCAQRRVGVNHRAREASVKLCIGFARVQLPQHHLAMRPRQFEHTIRETAILVFVDETQHGIPRLAGTRNHVDRRRGARIDDHSMTNRHDRIQYGARGVGQRSRISHRKRRGERTATADEAHPVRLE